MTPEESRENFIESLFSEKDISLLKNNGLFHKYVTGEISINTIYNQFKEQGL